MTSNQQVYKHLQQVEVSLKVRALLRILSSKKKLKPQFESNIPISKWVKIIINSPFLKYNQTLVKFFVGEACCDLTSNPFLRDTNIVLSKNQKNTQKTNYGHNQK